MPPKIVFADRAINAPKLGIMATIIANSCAISQQTV